MMVTLQGEIVGLSMDADTARTKIDSIKWHIEQAENHLGTVRAQLWELREQKGWQALGYKSWRQCVLAEFDSSAATVYKQLNAALVELELSPMGDIGQINERVLRPLTKREYSKESRQLIWDISQDIVGAGGKITSGVVDSVVEGIADWLKSGTVQSPDGEQNPITEHLKADLTARVREVRLAHADHIKHMGKQRDYILGGVAVDKITRGQLAEGKVAAIIPLGDITREKLVEALRLGKPIYCSLWTEE